MSDIQTFSKSLPLCGLGMSNLGGSIDEGFEDALRAEPAAVRGKHYAWNFCGDVYFADGMFHEDVYSYRVLVGSYTAPSLRELMEVVNAEHGYE